MAVLSSIDGRDVNARSPLMNAPQSYDEWVALYVWLSGAIGGEPYSIGDHKALHLFRALDQSGQTLHQTHRLIADVHHILDVDVRALSSSLTLEAANGEDPPETDWGVWRRSRIATRAQRWARWMAGVGDVWLVPFVGQGGGRVAAYAPQYVRAEYDDEDGTRIMRAEIELDWRTSDMDDEVHQMRRILDDRQVRVEVDGRTQDQYSGPHGLGVCPVVHAQWAPSDVPEHGYSACHHYWRALSAADSIMAQGLASANRYADPVITMIGVNRGTAKKEFGRWITGLPKDAKVEYLDSPMQGIQTALEMLDRVRGMIKEAPEFIFTEAGANSSGLSLSYRASALEAKLAGPRESLFEAVATAVQMASDLEAGTPYDADEPRLQVTAPPVLPRDAGAELDVILRLRDQGMLTREDAIRHLQRMDYIPDEVSADEYAARLTEEARGMVELFRTPQPGQPGQQGAEDEDPNAEPDPNEDEKAPPFA